MMVSKGNHPQMAELFKLVNDSNLPRTMENYHSESVNQLSMGIFHSYVSLPESKLDKW